jgi:hypothetical protein
MRETTMSTDTDTPEANYSTWELLESADPSVGAIGTGDLVRLLHDPDFELSTAQSSRLFRSPALRAKLRSLKAGLAATSAGAIEMPTQAAASSGDLKRRRLDGAWLEIVPASNRRDIYVRIIFDAGRTPASPCSFVIEGRDGFVGKLSLGQPDPLRRDCQRRLNPTDPADAAKLAALRDPSATGYIVVHPV